jgi:NAD+ kinase
MNNPTFMKPFKRIAIVSNATKAGATQVGAQLKDMAVDHGVEATLSTQFPAPSGLLRGMDACFVIGGDGTLLNLMEEAVSNDVPGRGNQAWTTRIFGNSFP